MHITQSQFNNDLFQFLKSSPSPFHAVQSMALRFEAAGFTKLEETKTWLLAPKSSYYVTRNDSSIIAFSTGSGDFVSNGIKMVGAHTDSPCLKLKPNPEIVKNNMLQLGVEVYGGVLLNPWFDRDLSLAGRVTWQDEKENLHNTLINFEKPIATVPSLAIHLDRDVNKGRAINPQVHLSPLLATLQDDNKNTNQLFEVLLKEKTVKENPTVVTDSNIQLLDHDLFFYDTQPPVFIGINQDFMASARLDNLLSCFTGMQSLLSARSDLPCLLVCNDHEEVGSASTTGAQGNFLQSVLERITGTGEPFTQAMQSSLLISTDNAHAQHPNFPEKHDENHVPKINSGPVIKINANQRYATNSFTSALFKKLCYQQGVQVQTFVSRNDVSCGSTIGPLTATQIGVPTLDVGLPTFGMHSIRELAGSNDAFALAKVLLHFFNGA